MPELPEVETVARSLRAPLEGRSIMAVTIGWPRTIACLEVAEFRRQIGGRRIRSVGRRGKYVVIELDKGSLLVHLKMSGRLQVVPREEPLDAHTHTVFELDNGWQLRFRDVRKFGRVYLVEQPDQVTSGLGPEPLDPALDLDRFRGLLQRRSGRLKSLLLNQSFLAGLGNIYADEALFWARLHPLRRADSLGAEEQERLYDAIRTVLAEAIVNRGTTLSDGGYTDASGEAGGHQDRIAVYQRTGEPCRVCGAPIERLVIGGRSSHFCPQCQEGM